MKKHMVMLSCLLSALGLLGCGSGVGAGSEGDLGGPSFASNESATGNDYAFGIPKGFKIVGTPEKLPPNAVTPTAIATPAASGPFSGIVVGEFPAGTVPAVNNEADLKKQIPQVEVFVKKLGKRIGATPSPVDQLTVNNHLALHWTLSGEAGGPYPGTDAEATLVFDAAGTSATEVTCRWGHGAGEKQAIKSGCLKVIASLKVYSPRG